ncbi:fatty acid hydroxylase superfamily-domain-containing protein [Aspergillus granulosus]|uniref:Fatty acid hydroxylase superfamily-domain-containing protein n=1 Tax=Aspergillus granulosus TaxID=176169 RepID=A0ABR4H3E4_9EURO
MDTTVKPKDSMKSTWRDSSKDNWNFYHLLIDYLDVYPVDRDKEVPVHAKDEKIPYVPQWSLHRWVLLYSAIPLVLHQVYSSYTGRDLGPIAAFNLYFAVFNAIVIHQVRIIRRLGHEFGYLDGDKHERDGIPDVGVGKVVQALYKTTGARLAMGVYLSYHANQLPATMNWGWLPLEIGLYGIVLDFWFYWYHRAMHDVGFLWKFHRTHHLSKHPNPLLSAYADHEQEFFDMAGVPLLTYMTLKALGLPMGFYEWWVCHQYIAFTEVLGHSGLRLHGNAPSTLGWLLDLLGADIVIEDHDLHHRKGYRKSYNYGKQTRLWDRIFGTCHDRIESARDNIDYSNTMSMPLF